jgi:hypothetical protein
MSKSNGILAPRTDWTTAMTTILIKRYPNEPSLTIANDLGIKLHCVYQKARRLDLKKSAEFLASPQSGRTDGQRGNSSRFQAGHSTWNKGTNFTAGGRSPETRFKQGQDPHNTQAIGSYRITKDGTLQQKISNVRGNSSQRWRAVHELVWIATHGAMPSKHIVVFKKDMSTNKLEDITIDRIECISRSELMKRNTVHNLPKELAELVQLRGALNRKINRRIKHEQY